MSKRPKMFSCRLSEVENKQLMDLLNIIESSSNEFVQNRFRNMIRILSARLYVDNLDYLRLRSIEGEVDPKVVEELSASAYRDFYDVVLSQHP